MTRRSSSSTQAASQIPIYYAATIFLGAFLLFLVQPVIAKEILPWFGGAASVWTTCLVFFQVSLLAGYAYSDFVVRRLSLPSQVKLHVVLLIVSLASVPIIPAPHWKPSGSENPPLLILALLSATIGGPYFLLSTTSPMVQSWLTKAHPGSSPYRLFGLSNAASLLALLGYPFLLEPWVVTRSQAWVWSAGYAAFIALCGFTGWASLKRSAPENERLLSSESPSAASRGPTPELKGPAGRRTRKWQQQVETGEPTPATETDAAPTGARRALWATLAATSVLLLLAVTNRITQDIASVPLLWILPLAIYLATFTICFDHSKWYRRGVILGLLAASIPAMGWMLISPGLEDQYQIQIPVFCVGLFGACMFCHGELARSKPSPAHLTRFYLMIALGGAVGSVLVGILAPLLLPGYFEIEGGLVAIALLLFWQVRRDPVGVRALAVATALAAVILGGWSIREFYTGTVSVSRNFYGVLRVRESGTGTSQSRTLVHGGVRHGTQYVSFPDYPTSYYVPTSGIGRVLSERPNTPFRIGLVGMGIGTIAAYGLPGDVLRFYEINPDVIWMAQHDFTYLRLSKATVETVVGDARLSLENEPDQGFDVLVVDAFFGDAIPMHLLTVEAMALYKRHVKPDGIIAMHISNRFLDLIPVVAALAKASDLYAVYVQDDTSEEPADASDWILLSRRPEVLNSRPKVAEIGLRIEPPPGKRPWTDGFNNLVQAIK